MMVTAARGRASSKWPSLLRPAAEQEQESQHARAASWSNHAMRPLIVLLVLAGCSGPDGNLVQSGREDGASARSEAAARVVRSFPVNGVTKVILRAAEAASASVAIDPGLMDLEVSGLPIGGAPGYRSPDPNWRETPSSEWGLDFVSARFGPVLVISTKNEMRFIHHGYSLTGLALRVPASVEIVREPRQLSGAGKPDLAAPASEPSTLR
jgi:hypothetical protein